MSKETYEHSWWAVCFLDLLGQQEAFLKTDFMPGKDDQSAREALIREVKASLGVVRQFHELASAFGLNVGGDVIAPDSPLLGLPPELREQAQRLKQTRVKELRWSDGLIFYTSLAPDVEHTPMIAVQNMLLCAASLHLMQLAQGRPIRGGIDVGTGIEAQGQLFGAGLVKSYQLESKAAEYPRIVVGTTLVEYLASVTSARGGDPRAQLSTAIAGNVGGLLCRDDDDLFIVDYLGEAARNVFSDQARDLSKFVHLARQFVEDSRSRWRQADEKLFTRYSRLARYFDRRMHLWPVA